MKWVKFKKSLIFFQLKLKSDNTIEFVKCYLLKIIKMARRNFAKKASKKNEFQELQKRPNFERHIYANITNLAPFFFVIFKVKD